MLRCQSTKELPDLYSSYKGTIEENSTDKFSLNFYSRLVGNANSLDQLLSAYPLIDAVNCYHEKKTVRADWPKK